MITLNNDANDIRSTNADERWNQYDSKLVVKILSH